MAARDDRARYGREDPLSDRELRILRGMMDEYESERYRQRQRDEFWTEARVRVAVAAGTVTIISSLATMVVVIAHL